MPGEVPRFLQEHGHDAATTRYGPQAVTRTVAIRGAQLVAQVDLSYRYGLMLRGRTTQVVSLKGRVTRMTLTAPVTLNLTTPRTVSKAMALLGIRWMPTPVPGSVLNNEHGLYTWVDGRGAFCQCGCGHVTLSDDLLDRGILYNGVGESTSGVIGRVNRETSFIGEGSDHGHGMAMYRRLGVPVVGNVELMQADLSWIDGRIRPDGAEITHTWLSGIRTEPTTLFKAAERLAIRICIHVGDVGAPVNSTHAGGWESNHGADWAAFAVAAEMRADPPSSPGGSTVHAPSGTTV